MRLLKMTALAAAAGFVASTPVFAAHTIGYQFNDPSPTAADGAAAGTAPGLNIVAPGVIGGPGSGVSGTPGDRAFDNSAATAMGGTTNGSGGSAMQASDFNAIDGLLQFTVSGWFKTDGTAPIGGNAVIAYNRSGVNGFAVYGDPNVPGNLVLAVDNGSNSSPGFGATQQYVNFAVTYDGTALQPGPNVFFYAGGVGQPLALVGSGTNTNGSGNDPATDETSPLSIGSRILFGTIDGDPFDGLIDNLRIYDSVRTIDQLETARLADVAVPEPASLAVVGLGALALLRRRRA